MGKKDLTTKVLEDYNDVFADIMNVLLFKRYLITEDSIENGPTESVYKVENNAYREQRRDVLKKYKGTDVIIASLGIENQSGVDVHMPIRIMGYDYASYRSQVDNKEELHPVITLVLNFSKTDWNEPRNLLGLLKISDELKGLVFDYGCHVADVHLLDDEIIEQFQSDFKYVAYFFKYGEACIEKIGDVGRLVHPQEVIDLLAVFNNKDMSNTKKEIDRRLKEGQVVNMCTIVQDIENKGMTLKIISQIRKKRAKEVAPEDCAEMLEVDVLFVRKVYELIDQYPDMSDRELYQKID